MLNVRGPWLYDGDKPFFWLGDTAWLLLENLSGEDMELYLENRAGLGYNVVQVVLFYSLPGGATGGMSAAGKDIFSQGYFALADRLLDRAGELGIHVALLPCWGSYVKEGVLKAEDAGRFAEFLVRRFGGHDNLVWVLGGDIKGDADLPLFNALGRAIKAGDPRHLATFHPFGRTLSARWFAGEDWCDFHLFQSGHRRYDQARLNAWDDQPERWYGEDNWRYVEESFSYAPLKPCLDGEPSYEGIVQGLHDPAQPYWEAADVRRYAYWSVFAGACGFTYGNNAIMQFHTGAPLAGSYGVRETWREALHAPGGMQMGYLKALFEEIGFTAGRPRQDLLRSAQGERYHRVSLFGTADCLLAYTFLGEGFALSLEEFAGRELEGFWIDPRNGARSFLGRVRGGGEAAFCPTRRREGANDWVLLLRAKT